MTSDRLHRFMLALIATAIAAFSLGGLMFHRIPADNRDALFLALGIILGLSKDAFSFYFGASKGGVDLAERNQGIVEQAAAVPATVTIDQPADRPIPVEETAQ